MCQRLGPTSLTPTAREWQLRQVLSKMALPAATSADCAPCAIQSVARARNGTAKRIKRSQDGYAWTRAEIVSRRFDLAQHVRGVRGTQHHSVPPHHSRP